MTRKTLLQMVISQPKLRCDGDPFLWWQERKHLYPLLSVLARKYLSVQGTSTPAERVMSRMGLILTKKRLNLTGDLFSKIMFLSDCM